MRRATESAQDALCLLCVRVCACVCVVVCGSPLVQVTGRLRCVLDHVFCGQGQEVHSAVLCWSGLVVAMMLEERGRGGDGCDHTSCRGIPRAVITIPVHRRSPHGVLDAGDW